MRCASTVEGEPAPRARDGRPEAALSTPWGALSVTREGVLTLGARVLARDALPELARSPSGPFVAVVRRAQRGAEVVLWRLPQGPAVVLTGALSTADRPAFSADGRRLYVWGTDPTEPLVGLYRVALEPVGSPQRVLNVGLTRVSDPRFVLPPVRATSFRAEGTTLRWLGPAGKVRVPAP